MREKIGNKSPKKMRQFGCVSECGKWRMPKVERKMTDMIRTKSESTGPKEDKMNEIIWNDWIEMKWNETNCTAFRAILWMKVRARGRWWLEVVVVVATTTAHPTKRWWMWLSGASPWARLRVCYQCDWLSGLRLFILSTLRLWTFFYISFHFITSNALYRSRKKRLSACQSSSAK